MNPHTPGPWSVEHSNDSKRFPSVIIGFRPGLRHEDGSGSDASVKDSCCRLIINTGADANGLVAGHAYATMESCRANARLIAAAPEMYALLRRYYETTNTRRQGEALGLCDADARALMVKIDGHRAPLEPAVSPQGNSGPQDSGSIR